VNFSPLLFIPPVIFCITTGLILQTISVQPALIKAYQDALGQRLESLIIVIDDHHNTIEQEFTTISNRISMIEAKLDFIMYTTAIAIFVVFATS